MKSYIQLTKIAETYYDIWTSDGIDTIYLGPVEVYDPEEIEKIESEIASYNG